MEKQIKDGKLAGRGGPGRGQGRKSVSGVGASPVLRVRVSTAQLKKAEENGGAQWVRGLIDKA